MHRADQDHPADHASTSGAHGETAGDQSLAHIVACPFCHSREVELISLFGGQLSTDQYYCRACRTYFERFARDDVGPAR